METAAPDGWTTHALGVSFQQVQKYENGTDRVLRDSSALEKALL
jgi:hypothetical protein